MIVERRVVHLPLRQRVRGQRQNHDRRVGGIDLAVGRIARQSRRQQAARGVDRRLHVARGAVDVAGQIELQRDARRAERAARGHLGDAGDAAERALERRGDGRRHRFGAGARAATPAPRWSENRPAAAATPAAAETRSTPASATPTVSSVVATGRSMKGADRFTCSSRGASLGAMQSRASLRSGLACAGRASTRRASRSKAR